ncbi:hypothetical protein [Dactylosporangium sp. NPDC048998]|uniref:hypothetical protein n=1 Tax=Dactylosporangium sp. NPDC048998 TaxID=3363976 RepID=UPI003723D209
MPGQSAHLVPPTPGLPPAEDGTAEQVHFAPPPEFLQYPEPLAAPAEDLFPQVPVWPDGLLPHRDAVIALRADIVERVRSFGRWHALEAFSRRFRGRPIGPYAVALLFWTAPDAQGRQLRIDRRYYPKVRLTSNPVDVLQQLVSQVHAGWATPGFNLRRTLVSDPDPDWTAAQLGTAKFFGVALSSLDDPPGSGSWARTSPTVDHAEDLPIMSMIQCIDGGRMVVRQLGAEGRRAVQRSSSVALHTVAGFAPFAWKYSPDLNRIPVEHPDAHVWHQLRELARMIYWGWGQLS